MKEATELDTNVDPEQGRSTDTDTEISNAVSSKDEGRINMIMDKTTAHTDEDISNTVGEREEADKNAHKKTSTDNY